jgi:hypothetical protein
MRRDAHLLAFVLLLARLIGAPSDRCDLCPEKGLIWSTVFIGGQLSNVTQARVRDSAEGGVDVELFAAAALGLRSQGPGLVASAAALFDRTQP